MYCDVCQGRKKITVACWGPETIVPSDACSETIDTRQKDFPCPQCQMVPYRRVRAMKVTTGYPAEEFARYQVPIERSLAARFGEYLMREGLIRFTSTGSLDLGAVENKITVTAHLGVVSATDVIKAGAEAEVATTAAPKVSQERYGKLGKSRARRWVPPVDVRFPDEPVTDEFDEPKDALGARFSGLELG